MKLPAIQNINKKLIERKRIVNYQLNKLDSQIDALKQITENFINDKMDTNQISEYLNPSNPNNLWNQISSFIDQIRISLEVEAEFKTDESDVLDGRLIYIDDE